MYYSKDGKKISLLEWGNLLEDKDYKIIKQESLPNGKWISTVWLGSDHSYGDGEKLIFETMVFSKKGDCNDEGMLRYSTLQEAIEGHEKMKIQYS